MFSPAVASCTDSELVVQFKTCPLKSAWVEMGLPDQEVALFCDMAACADYGTLEEAGFAVDRSAGEGETFHGQHGFRRPRADGFEVLQAVELPRLEVAGHDNFIVKVPNRGAQAEVAEGREVHVGWKAADCRALDYAEFRH
mgnify:CR=1 FL=1